MIKRHCQSLVTAVFNIIVHLQSPLIFYDNLASGTVARTPDPGSAILMCVETLFTVSRKHALFPMDVWHVGHLLHIPAVLFQNFHQLRVTKASSPSEALMISEEHICDPVERINFCHIDHQFSVKLFVACCQLLFTVIRHRPRYVSFFCSFKSLNKVQLQILLNGYRWQICYGIYIFDVF